MTEYRTLGQYYVHGAGSPRVCSSACSPIPPYIIHNIIRITMTMSLLIAMLYANSSFTLSIVRQPALRDCIFHQASGKHDIGRVTNRLTGIASPPTKSWVRQHFQHYNTRKKMKQQPRICQFPVLEFWQNSSMAYAGTMAYRGNRTSNTIVEPHAQLQLWAWIALPSPENDTLIQEWQKTKTCYYSDKRTRTWCQQLLG